MDDERRRQLPVRQRVPSHGHGHGVHAAPPRRSGCVEGWRGVRRRRVRPGRRQGIRHRQGPERKALLDGPEPSRTSWTITPFDGSDVYTRRGELPDSDSDGISTLSSRLVNSPAPTGSTPGSSPTATRRQTAGEPVDDSAVVKAGQAVIAEWTTRTSPAGRHQHHQGRCRHLRTRGRHCVWPAAGSTSVGRPTGDAVVAPQASQPAGTTRDSDTSAHDTSDANGAFSVALIDPTATTPANETGGDLTATPVGNAADGSDTIEVDFLKSMSPANADDITIDEQALFGLVTPGRPVDLDIEVENADGDMLTDYPVEVTVNKGFLSPDAEDKDELVADPAARRGWSLRRVEVRRHDADAHHQRRRCHRHRRCDREGRWFRHQRRRHPHGNGEGRRRHQDASDHIHLRVPDEPGRRHLRA